MSHNHQHHHEVNDYNRAFAIGIVLNIVFVAVEAGYGLLADSLTLIADAGHNLSDVVSLLLAWGATLLATKAVTEKRTYGLRKATIMASLISAILLLVALGGIAWEAVGRFTHQAPVEGVTVITVAAIGVVINGVTALLFIRGQKHDLNIKGAFLHMAADAGVSLGVVVAGIFMMAKGWTWIDPVMSLVIVAIIFAGTWGLLRDSMNYAMDAVPNGIDVNEIKDYLMSLDRIEDIHDLHVWPMSTTEAALSVHLMVKDETLDNDFLWNLQHHLHEHFQIGHSTIQLEASKGKTDCMLDYHDCC